MATADLCFIKITLAPVRGTDIMGREGKKGLERRGRQRTAGGDCFGLGLGSRRTDLVTLGREADGRGGKGVSSDARGCWPVREHRRSQPVGVTTREKDSRRTWGSERSLGRDETPVSSSHRQLVRSFNKHLSGVDGGPSEVRGLRVGPGRTPPDNQGPGWSSSKGGREGWGKGTGRAVPGAKGAGSLGEQEEASQVRRRMGSKWGEQGPGPGGAGGPPSRRQGCLWSEVKDAVLRKDSPASQTGFVLVSGLGEKSVESQRLERKSVDRQSQARKRGGRGR